MDILNLCWKKRIGELVAKENNMERLTRCVGYQNGKPIYKTNIDMRCNGSVDKLKNALGKYEDLEVTPEQIKEIDKLYKEKCEEVNKLKSGGWIPCGERLPEEHDSIFVQLKGTDKWKNSMFEKTSNSVIVTVVDNKGQAITTYAHTVDGKWNCDLLRCNKNFRIKAWMPLPEAYKEEK